MDRTDSKIDTPAARGDSRPVRYAIISPDGHQLLNLTYSTALEAATTAGQIWPGIAQRDHDNGAEGWDIEVVRN